MNDTWQMYLTLACVAGAAILLVCRIWRQFTPSGNCGGGCSSCPSGSKIENPQLIQLELKAGKPL